MPTRRRGLLQALGLKRAQPLGLPNPNTFGSIIPGSDIDANPIGSKREALTQFNGWVFAAATFIAEEARGASWDIWRKRGANRDEWTIDDATPLQGILQRPNATQSWGDLLELTDLHLSLNGEWYWHIIRDGPRALGLEVIYPHHVQTPVIEGGRVTGWRVQKPNGALVILPAEDVIRGHRPHPLNPFMAASTIEAAAVSHYFDLYVRAYGMTLFRNDGGIPAGLLSSDQSLTPEQAADLRESWRQRYTRTRGEVAVLGANTKYQPITIPMQELKFLELGQFTRDQVLGLFRVSSALLGLTGDSNRANLEAALWGFQRHTLQPRLLRVAEVIRTRVIPAFADARLAPQLWFEFRPVVSKDEERERATATTMLKAGAITINEYRMRLGASALDEGGDVFLMPARVSVVESPADLLGAAPVNAPPEPERAAEPAPEASSELLAARLATAHAESELAAVRAREREAMLTRKLRGFFARAHRDAKAAGRNELRFESYELSEMGIINGEALEPLEGESMTVHAERLKSRVARDIAKVLASGGTA